METNTIMIYTWAFVILIVFFLISMGIAFSIPIKPDMSDRLTRKVWFWVMCALTPVCAFFLNFILCPADQLPEVHSNYMAQSGISAGLVFVIFILIGFGISKSAPRSKMGSWFS